MIDEKDYLRAANLYIARYGGNALREAHSRQQHFAERDNTVAVYAWSKIIAAIETLSAAPTEHTPIH